jgi:hypothetical protein
MTNKSDNKRPGPNGSLARSDNDGFGMFSSHLMGEDIIQLLHPFPGAGPACLWIKPGQLDSHSDVENNIENMKAWSASEEKFDQLDGFDLAFPF